MAIQPSTTVLRDVSNSIKNLLISRISDLHEGNISFKSPGEYEQSSSKSLSQFLFQIKINDYMRNLGKKPAEMEGGGYSASDLRNSPIIVDLIYMFTPFGPDQVVEMELLEQIMGTLYDYPVLSGDLLDGSLKEVGNDKIRITPLEFGTEILNNIWSIFPNKSFKTSLFYTLSPVRILSSKLFNAPRISSTKIDINKIS